MTDLVGTLSERQIERFWAKVDRSGAADCWPWRGHIVQTGYGLWSVNDAGRSTSVRPHRIAYALTHVPIPDDMQVDHLCRNRACCNPAHLEPVTHTENQRRAQPYRPPAVSRGASMVERPRLEGGSSWRVMFRPNGKMTAVTFRERPEAEAFVALCGDVGTVEAYRRLRAS